jgi:hypothetical protein
MTSQLYTVEETLISLSPLPVRLADDAALQGCEEDEKMPVNPLGQQQTSP